MASSLARGLGYSENTELAANLKAQQADNSPDAADLNAGVAALSNGAAAQA